MNKTYAVLLLSVALSVIASATPASATSSFTTYQMEFREVTANEAQGVIDRAIGSGTVDIGTGEQLLKSARTTTHGASQKWLNDHPDAKIVGGVPFYGTRNLPVAYEYFIACGDKICGEFYEVFPNATGMDDAVRMFRR